MNFIIRKVEGSAGPLWWDGSNFTYDIDKTKKFVLRDEADKELFLAQSKSIFIEVKVYEEQSR